METTLRHHAVVPVHTGQIAIMELVPGSSVRKTSFQPGQVQVSWFRIADYEVVLMHGGIDVCSQGTYCDGIALFSGYDAALKCALAVALAFAVTPDSTLRVVLRVSVSDVPNLPLPKPVYSTFNHWGPIPDRCYLLDIQRGERWLTRSMDERVMDDPLPTIDTVWLADGAEIWASDMSSNEAKCTRLMLSLLARRPFEHALIGTKSQTDRQSVTFA